jgi:deoxyribonuclease V
MQINQLHRWDVSASDAVKIQKNLGQKLDLRPLAKKVNIVAGADMSSSRSSDRIWAGIVVYKYPELIKLEEKWVQGRTQFPYIPGLLSFREVPLLLETVKLLEINPDLILCDGQGIAHPRGLGLASHLGLLLNLPTIGCAKSRLIGEVSEVGLDKGDYTMLRNKGRVIGAVLRTRTGVKPLFISPGNKINLEDSLKIVLGCSKRYRMPEPTRQAHLLVNRVRRNDKGQSSQSA